MSTPTDAPPPRRYQVWLNYALLVPVSLLALPLGVVIAVCLMVHYRSLDIFFTQQRIGWAERPFWLYKFRTMRHTRDAQGNLLPDALRLTRLGKWLRRTSLDEIPQLYHIWRGEMAWVGPRPLLPQYLPLYSATQRQRHLVLPGITGWAQVQGRNALPWATRLALDVWYVQHQSLGLDVYILWLTLWRVWCRPDGDVPATPFRGEQD